MEENRLYAVSNACEFNDEEIFPHLGFALIEEDKWNKIFKKSLKLIYVPQKVLTN